MGAPGWKGLAAAATDRAMSAEEKVTALRDGIHEAVRDLHDGRPEDALRLLAELHTVTA